MTCVDVQQATKVCSCCGERKPLKKFAKHKLGKSGRNSQCNTCVQMKKRDGQYTLAGKVSRKLFPPIPGTRVCSKCKTRRPANCFAKSKGTSDGLNPSCKSCQAESGKAYRAANRRKMLQKNRDYREQSRESIRIQRREYLNQRYKSDPTFQAKAKLRRATRRIKEAGHSKSSVQLTGISPSRFSALHGNPDWSKWHLDHIVPLSWFDLSIPSHVRVAAHWTNLQLLSESDNLLKGDRFAGTPSQILAFREHFDITAYVNDMLLLIEGLGKW